MIVKTDPARQSQRKATRKRERCRKVQVSSYLHEPTLASCSSKLRHYCSIWNSQNSPSQLCKRKIPTPDPSIESNRSIQSVTIYTKKMARFSYLSISITVLIIEQCASSLGSRFWAGKTEGADLRAVHGVTIWGPGPRVLVDCVASAVSALVGADTSAGWDLVEG